MPPGDGDADPHHAPRRRLVGRLRPAAHPRLPAPTRREPTAAHRFRTLDHYRVEREWKRYEGTPQRELFRELRGRFLERHRPSTGWAVDIGSGPGRFASLLGGDPAHRILLDLSVEMLRSARARAGPADTSVKLVRGDAIAPPLRAGRFAQVVALGNPLGFAADRSDLLLENLLALVAPGGTVVIEVVCGPGERSRYLTRLPPGATRRLLVAPVNLVRSRAEREGFRAETRLLRTRSEFRRHDPSEVIGRLEAGGFGVEELLSVAPVLGADPARVAAAWADPLAWVHLLELEEQIGRSPNRHRAAAALLIAARRS